MISKKSQIWFTDFVIGMLIFSFMLVTYYIYMANLPVGNKDNIDLYIENSKTLSSALLSSGSPYDWNNETVEVIGIANKNYEVNVTKLIEFSNINYNQTKRYLGTNYDYVMFFLNESGNVTNVGGVCGIGLPDVNITYDIRSAYYYDNSGDSFLKNFMREELNADIYSAEGSYPDFDSLIASIEGYQFVVIEHPLFPTAVFEGGVDEIESFLSSGGILMLSGQMSSSQGAEMAGVKFYKKSGQSVSDRNSTIVAEDPFLAFDYEESIVFKQAYYIENLPSAENFLEIAKFNADSNTALARWDFGDGKAFYFSDFDVSYFDGNFVQEISNAIRKWGNFKCNNIDLSNIDYNNFVNTERFLVYGERPIKMVVYTWG